MIFNTERKSISRGGSNLVDPLLIKRKLAELDTYLKAVKGVSDYEEVDLK